MRLIVIGGVAAGTKAASRARRLDPELEITIYQEEPEISISECGLPYFISGVVAPRESLVARTPEDLAEKDIEVLVRHRVEEINPGEKTLLVKDLATGEIAEDSYDRLIISTGAKSLVPPLDGVDLDGVFKLRFLTDADGIRRYIREHEPRRAAVVGGGYIGLEVAESLVSLGMEVALFEAGDRVAGSYGPEVSQKVEDHLAEKGVSVFTGEEVESFVGEDGRVSGVRFGEREAEAELVIMSIGVRPEVSLAEAAGVEIGATGTIKVDKCLRTNLPDVWAAGDCAESTNLVTGEAFWAPLGDTANQMGRVAGTNAAAPGGEDSGVLEFPGVLGTVIFKVFDLAVAKTGLTEEDATDAGYEVATAAVERPSIASYYPGAGSVYLKLVADRNSGRLLGAEAVGDTADKLVDICATAIWGKLSYPDLVNLDFAYAPPFGPALNPIIQAARVISYQLVRKCGVRAPE